LLLGLFAVEAALTGSVQTPTSHQAITAPTPPMGWNSWDSHGLTITESQFKANAEWLNKHLKAYGWQYLVIDDGWYLNDPENHGNPAWKYTLSKDGRYMPAEGRFPSAADGAGLKPVADYVHELGLKFGIHILRGIPRAAVKENLPIANSPFHAAEAADKSDTCRWNPDNYGVKANPAGQAYYDSIAKLYAEWGVDFLKVDCISFPYKDAEIRMISTAIRKTGRPIVLSLSPGPTPLAKHEQLVQYAQMWRITDDIWDHWKHTDGKDWNPSGVADMFPLAAKWIGLAQPGHWPDGDILPFGFLGPQPGWGPAREAQLTHAEEQTMTTLWCMFRSPLMLGGDLPLTDPSVLRLVTNSEVIAIDQNSTGNHPVITTDKTVVWIAQPSAGDGYYVAVFNVGNLLETVRYPWVDLGLSGKTYRLRDLWEHKNIGRAKSLTVTLQPHAAALYRLWLNR
jgi:hypothetical protein